MILKALYDYYNRSDKVAPVGKEYKEIVFIVVIKHDGSFVRIEDTRNEDGNGNKYLVAKSWGRKLSRCLTADMQVHTAQLCSPVREVKKPEEIRK